MKSLLKDNPLGIGLLVVASVLLLLSLVLPLFSGGLPAVANDSPAGGNQVLADMTKLSSLEPIANYVVINQRPVFNQDRKPVDISKTSEGAADASLAEAEALADNPLEADLTGVIITSDQRIAMLWDRAGKTTISMAEGEALEGELSNWSVQKVEARKVSFKNQKGEVAELELLMFTDSLGKPPATNSKTGRNKTNSRAKAQTANNTARHNAGGKASPAGAKADKTPMNAADFMRASLEQRKAARKSRDSKNATAAKKKSG